MIKAERWHKNWQNRNYPERGLSAQGQRLERSTPVQLQIEKVFKNNV
jgi:hypothetical protein